MKPALRALRSCVAPFPGGDKRAQDPMTIAAPDGKLPTIEYLRGFAALMVCWFHLTNSYPWEAVRFSGTYGWLGVEVFFVISGFVLPLSLWSRYGTNYSASAFGNFAKRRVLRIEPPYLVSVLLAAILWWASSMAPGFRGSDPDLSLGKVLAHIAYLPTVMGYNWIQPVYWTLAYEFCFYIVIGLAYPMLIRSPLPTTLLVTAAISMLSFVIFKVFDPRILLFPLGGIVFLDMRGLISRRATLATGVALVVIAAMADWRIAAAGATTAAIIHLYVAKRASTAFHAALMFLGGISYSLYITHVPVGGRVVNLGSRIVDGEVGRLLLSLLALAICLAFAWGFHRLIERPFVLLSKRKKGVAVPSLAGQQQAAQ